MNFFKLSFAISLFAFIVLIHAVAPAADVELGWDPPETSAAFVRYKIYWGEQSGTYTQHREIGQQHTSITISDLQPGKTYYFVATTIYANGDESPYSDEIEVPIAAETHRDTDGDGISDQDELKTYGTDPRRADTDGDGIDDGDEIAFWRDDWHRDADGDGLINVLDRDADNDGVADAAEIDAQDDPADAFSARASHTSTPANHTPELTALPIVSVRASAEQQSNLATYTIDGDLGTHWSAKGDGQWIMYDIGVTASVAEVAIAWANGDREQAAFTIEASIDGSVWNDVLSADSSGDTLDLESYTFAALPARYIRIVGYGNPSNLWNQITETEIYGQFTLMPLPIQSVRASQTDRPHLPGNTLDGDLQTRWSAEGDGQWIMYDAGAMATISEVALAWAHGDRRTASFTIEVSLDGRTWKEVYSGDSSGDTNDLETYTFPSVPARYVLIAGYGNEDNLWTNITETEIRGYRVDVGTLEQKTVGKHTYTVKLVVQDDFDTLDNWLIDMPHPETVAVDDNTLRWNAYDTLGTLWNKTRIDGPSIVEYDVQTLDGKLNINGIFYGSLMDQGRETLLDARRDGNGVYKEYSHFQNYMMTYLDPEDDGVWRIRFRKNPGFKIVAETHKRRAVDPNTYQRMTYVFDADGAMKLYADNKLLQVYKDKQDAHRRGYHALRIFETISNYKNFKIYHILPSGQ